VVGTPAEEAADRLTALGFQVDTGRPEYDRDVPEGAVVRVRPKAGAEVEIGSIVTIVRSLGPPPVAVPAVEGRPLKDAKQMLVADGFEVGSIEERYHPKVPAGRVISRTPAGDELPAGSVVELDVSMGPTPVKVPDVGGKARENAISILGERGFSIVVQETFSKDVARGFVIRTDPANGELLQPGETIVVNVSLGPREFRCPTFVGLTLDEAEARALSYGLRLNAVEVPGATGARIVSQEPPAGTMVRFGETIDAYYA
jgi:eukaryotic-like serine/threonine-protein kinase